MLGTCAAVPPNNNAPTLLWGSQREPEPLDHHNTAGLMIPPSNSKSMGLGPALEPQRVRDRSALRAANQQSDPKLDILS